MLNSAAGSDHPLPDPMWNVLCWSCPCTEEDPRLCRFLPQLQAMGANVLDLINPQWIDPQAGRARLGLIDPALRAQVLQRSRASVEELHAAGLLLHGSLDTGAFRPDSFAAAGLDHEDFYGRAPDGSVMEAYQGQFFDQGAYLSCFNNPHWRALMVRQVQQLAEAGFDGLRWDSYTYVTHPFGYACHCRYCLDKWHHHCQETGGREEPLPENPFAFDDPVVRAAMRWRWDCFVEYVRAVKDAVQAEYPSFVFSANLGALLPDSVYLWRSGVLDLVHTEEWWHSLPPFYDGYGCQLMRAAAPDRPAVTLHNCREPWTAARVRVGLAEALANGAVWQGGSLYLDPVYEVQREMGQFVLRHADLFRAARPFARVALLYSENNRAWRDLQDHPDPYVARNYRNPCNCPDSTRWLAQVLADAHVPYVVLIAERGLDQAALAGLDTIVLSDQGCASEATLSAISGFLEDGGGVIVTGEIGVRDEDNVLRSADAFARRPLTRLGPGLHRVGKGRLARLAGTPEAEFYRSCPRNTQAFAQPPEGPMERPSPVPAALEEALRWAIPQPLVRLEARQTTVVSLTRTPRALLVHLVNYDLFEDHEHLTPDPEVVLRLRPPKPVDISAAELCSPDRDPERAPLRLTRDGEWWVARIGELQAYAIVVLPWSDRRGG